MAYTPLTTQVAGGTASAAGWANLVKANFESMGPHLIVRKPSDESVTSNAVPQADDHLILPVLANEVWQFQFFVVVGAAATGDFSCRFSFPAGGDLRMSIIAMNSSGTVTKHDFSTTTSPTGTRDFQVNGTSTYLTLPFEGVFVTGGTAGNVTLEWAQTVSDVTATTVKANSTLWAVKLA